MPTATVASALPQTSLAMSYADLPPTVQYAPFAPVGIEPSTTAMYAPFWFSTTE